MSGGTDDLLRSYQRELSYLRQLGGQFAARYPRIAARLALSDEEAADPHVERLIESFAFLTARLQNQLDSEFPQFTSALLGVLYPQFLEPVPSMAIARFDVDAMRGVPPSGYRIESQRRLYARAHSGISVHFTSCYPVTVWPLAVTETQQSSADAYPFLDRYPIEVPPGAAAGVVRVRLASRGGPISGMDLKKLRFHLGGEGRSAYELYELLLCDLMRVAVVSDRDPTRPVFLSPDVIRPVGFAEDEAILPARSHAHPAYRLLQEYFSFPDKFLFFDIDPLPTGLADRHVDLLFFLKRRPREPLALDERSFQLGCTPIVNLFHKTSEPIRLNHTQSEYRLVASHERDRYVGIHSIQSVSVSSDPQSPARRVPPFFSFNHPADGEEHTAFWHASRRPASTADAAGSELWLSFTDLRLAAALPPTEVLFAHTLCTNRHLASQLTSGSELHLEESAPLRGISCVSNPTMPVEPPVDESLWRLVSQLSLNHLSLTHGPESLNALREILRLYRFTTPNAVDPQIAGLREMKSSQAVRRVGVDAWRGFCRGMEIELVVDEGNYVGGSALLLGTVLSYFFGLYASANSFTQLVLRRQRTPKEVWKRWPPMAGNRPVL